MAESPTFLSIPAELRIDIYLRLFNRREPRNMRTYHSIMYVCRQTQEEAMQVLLLGPRYLHSFHEVLKWIRRANPAHLKFVKNIDVRSDVAEAALLRDHTFAQGCMNSTRSVACNEWYARHMELLERAGEIPTPNVQSSSQPEYSNLHPLSWIKGLQNWVTGPINQPTKPDDPELETPETSIAAISQVFELLPDLDKIWLNLGSSSRGSLKLNCRNTWSIEQQVYLEMISAKCQNLREFTYFSGLTPLSFIRNLSNLRMLRFNGYSLSSQEETTSVLSSLKHLNSICLYRYPEFYDKDYGTSFELYSDHVSFTPKCLAAISPLVSFEIRHSTSRVSSHFLTMATITTLQKYHSHSLRQLWIHNDGVVDDDMFRALLRLVKASSRLKSLLLVTGTTSPIDEKELVSYLPDGVKRGGGGKVSVIFRCGDKTIEYQTAGIMQFATF
ncbi:MAG: hypothetical protein Q9160_004742 [Pyrenula sp. 1 TL-2023]